MSGLSEYQQKIAALKQQKLAGSSASSPSLRQQQQQQQQPPALPPQQQSSSSPSLMASQTTTTTAAAVASPLMHQRHPSRETIMVRAGHWKSQSVSSSTPSLQTQHQTPSPVAPAAAPAIPSSRPVRVTAAPTPPMATVSPSNHQWKPAASTAVQQTHQQPMMPTVVTAKPGPHATHQEKAAWRASRMEIRKSRMIEANGGTDPLASIKEKAAMIERVIMANEAARQQAEANLLEIATAKMKEDVRVEQLGHRLNALITDCLSQLPADIKAQLEEIRDDLLCNTQSSSSPSPALSPPLPAVSTKSVLSMTPPPPPPPPPPPMAAAAIRTSPPPSHQPQQQTTVVTSGTEALMDQIRKGRKLRQMDVEKMKADQKKEWRMNNRKSTMIVASLEDTIRKAFAVKFGGSFNDTDEDDDDDDCSDDDGGDNNHWK